MLVSTAHPALARDLLVADQAQYKTAVNKAQPGDTIILADGEWRDFQIVFTGTGTAAKPIALTAQTKGKVLITGQSNLRIGGKHLPIGRASCRERVCQYLWTLGDAVSIKKK